ncbi:MAG: cytochrome b/b6 domain-containing protein [Proteobacteria bacterium]|nr:cytochrome b/b6 domain-containing protein [Pseudomonadota bacterium]MBU1710719.1 cytochrome b/b6 domain-containing protein [Pseudomonadota bacterium]
MKASSELIYIHPGPVRVWHWVNALGIVLLVLTGLQIRFAEILDFFTLEEAIKVHNYVGFIVIANYGLWVAYYFGTGKIKIYFPDIKTFLPNVIKQMKYYGGGIFKGDPNPHVMTPDNKFNALQQKAYLGLMFIFLPAQMITGVLLWRVKEYEQYINMLGGIKIVDTVHVLLFFFFGVFLFVHSYLATLGHTPTAHFKAMFTGYEEHH